MKYKSSKPTNAYRPKSPAVSTSPLKGAHRGTELARERVSDGPGLAAGRATGQIQRLTPAALKAALDYSGRILAVEALHVSERLATYHADATRPFPDVAADAAAPDSDMAETSRRRALLQRTAGMWKDRVDVPKDGLRYQREERAEWD